MATPPAANASRWLRGSRSAESTSSAAGKSSSSASRRAAASTGSVDRSSATSQNNGGSDDYAVDEQGSITRDQMIAINAFYGRLTNPLTCLPVDALIELEAATLAAAIAVSSTGASVGALAVAATASLTSRIARSSEPATVLMLSTIFR